MSEKHFDFDTLRLRLAAHGIHPAREPGEFHCHAEIDGLTPDRIGYDRFAGILRRLRREAVAVTGANHAISAVRDPRTHARRGYAVHTADQTAADQIAATIRSYL